jgi:tRNA(Ile)-lysidine synthase
VAHSLPEILLQQLGRLPSTRRYLIAFSGGADSMALLHAMVQLRTRLGANLKAVHLDHGLQPDSAQWAEWCARRCETLQLDHVCHRLALHPVRGESLEATARHARYAALASLMAAGDILLTAHQQNDQAETLLLRLVRGGGLAGLAAMPFCRDFEPGLLARPLLSLSREQIIAYLQVQQLDWLDDPSNARLDFDRNFLRHRLMPLLAQRWPAIHTTLSRTAGHCREADDLLSGQFREELARLCPQADRLDLSAFATRSLAQRHGLMRAWLAQLQAPVPNARQLERLCVELPGAARDRNPRVVWAGVEVRRYRQWLYFMPCLPAHDKQAVIVWPDPCSLELPGNGCLHLTDDPDGIPAGSWQGGRVEVRYRQGGEYCHGRHKSLKKLLQEWSVPPWLRDRLPLVYVDDQLLAVAGYGLCCAGTSPGGQGLRISWALAR